MFGTEFNYLKPTQEETRKIIHPKSYIKSNMGLQKSNRKIFSNVPLEQAEKQKIQDFQNLLKQQGINNAYTQNEANLLRVLQSQKFDLKKALEFLKKLLEWRNNPQNYEVSAQVQQILEEGWFYIAGRDFQLRPVIIFDMKNVDPKKYQIEDIKKAVGKLFLIASEYMMYPGVVENWVIIVDICDRAFHDVPLGMLNDIINTMSNLFPGLLEKCYLINPSTTLVMFWNLIKVVIDEGSIDKVQFVNSKQVSTQLQTFMKEPQELEQRFGGQAPQYTTFYPPRPYFLKNQQKIRQTEMPPTQKKQQKNIFQDQQRQSQQPQISNYPINQQPQKSQYQQQKYQQQPPQNEFSNNNLNNIDLYRSASNNNNQVQNTNPNSHNNSKININTSQNNIQNQNQNYNNNNIEYNYLPPQDQQNTSHISYRSIKSQQQQEQAQHARRTSNTPSYIQNNQNNQNQNKYNYDQQQPKYKTSTPTQHERITQQNYEPQSYNLNQNNNQYKQQASVNNSRYEDDVGMNKSYRSNNYQTRHQEQYQVLNKSNNQQILEEDFQEKPNYWESQKYYEQGQEQQQYMTKSKEQSLQERENLEDVNIAACIIF